MKPKEIKRQSSGLEVLWDDSEKSFCEFSAIRKNCTCAICKEMKTPLNESMPFYQKSISLKGMSLVGNYAVELLWGDGHRSIVSFDRLRSHEAR
jgi:DUF971 family protein